MHKLTVNGHADLEEKSYFFKEPRFGRRVGVVLLAYFVVDSWTVPLNVRAALPVGNLGLVKIQFLPFACTLQSVPDLEGLMPLIEKVDGK